MNHCDTSRTFSRCAYVVESKVVARLRPDWSAARGGKHCQLGRREVTVGRKIRASKAERERLILDRRVSFVCCGYFGSLRFQTMGVHGSDR